MPADLLFDLNDDSLPELDSPPAQLTPLDESIAFIAAWIRVPISISEWAKKLAAIDCRTDQGRRLGNHDVKTTFQRLIARGQLVQTPGSGYQMPAPTANALAADLPRRPEELARAQAFLKSLGAHSPWVQTWVPHELTRRLRNLRNAVLLGDYTEAQKALTLIQHHYPAERPWSFLADMPSTAILEALPAALRVQALPSCLTSALEDLAPVQDLRSVLDSHADTPDQRLLAAEYALACGDFPTAQRMEKALARSAEAAAVVAVTLIRIGTAFLKGQDDAAIAAFEDWKKAIRKITKKRNVHPGGLFSVWIIMAFCRRNQPGDLATAHQILVAAEKGDTPRPYLLSVLDELLHALTHTSLSDLKTYVARTVQMSLDSAAPGIRAYGVLIVAGPVGIDLRTHAGFPALLDRLHQRSSAGGWQWIAAEVAAVSSQIAPPADTPPPPLHPEIPPFAATLKTQAPWEKVLQSLAALSGDPAPPGATRAAKAESTKQLVWWLHDGEYEWALTPIERTVSANGKISKGRHLSFKRLKEQGHAMTHLTPQDQAAAARIRLNHGWGGYGEYVLADPAALLDLAGHPLLFSDEACSQPIELIAVQPRLVMVEKGGQISLSLSPPIDPQSETHLIRESERRYLVVDVKPAHLRIAASLGTETTFPASAKKQLTEVLGNLAGKVAIESDDIGSGGADIPITEGDPTPVLRLIPAGTGLNARLLIRPMDGLEQEERPGEGRPLLMAHVSGQPVRLRRDLTAERSAALALLTACPTLVAAESDSSEAWNYTLETPMECLDLLAELETLGHPRIEWPEGQTFRLRGVADGGKFQVNLGGSSEWLSASGELRVDDDLVLTMRELLELVGAASDTPGFIRLEDGQFLALTRAFRTQLEDLQTFSQPGKGDQLRIHPLAAGALAGLTESPSSKLGAAWKKQMKRLRDAETQNPVTPPSTLKAELRPYQIDGYRWLRRLADGGIGACLADDMGLGKTLQALALLLDRAPDGPALVVAPTSVAANWLEEARRFAPTLRPVLYGRDGGDRTATLTEAGPFDLVIVSYGLLQSDADAFAAVTWHTAILDEAQSIKNRSTKRFQAAAQLNAAFRLITTGTPVENRLSELHALFSFINPGFLGSWEYFRTTFADPIERRQDPAARERLRRLVRPFILRRLKSAVLQDLPARTEIPLHVELSPEEGAFYEALRQKALTDLEKAATEKSATPGQAAIRVLAELTRLRRACCHPRLIDSATALEGSKLRVFADTLEEILAGGHKALVFSQFVDHLAILRQHLDSAGVSYQYLDGSTPAAQRQKAVTAFQRGEGDVFLISLKAGGFGLNLTAADYVIHMDPWWNPAAEDQASDRAHRIGQTRPVTIYRLITTGTIEEKIVALHRTKRELADSILDGTDAAAHLSTDDLLALLRE